MTTVRQVRALLLQCCLELENERRRQALRDLVFEAFEPADSAKVKRSDVYRHVAARLKRPVSNALCLEVKEALLERGSVMESTSDGRARFIGLRRREESASAGHAAPVEAAGVVGDADLP